MSDLVQIRIRDVTELERRRVLEALFPVICGDEHQNVDFAAETQRTLASKKMGPPLVHLDLDGVDVTLAPVNKL